MHSGIVHRLQPCYGKRFCHCICYHGLDMAPSLLDKFRTVDVVYKLNSYPVSKSGHSVATMDKVTTQELSDAIVYESDPFPSSTHARKLGYALNTIFEEFAADIPFPKSLLVLQETVQKYDPTILPNSFTHMIPLYDCNAERWNWPMPFPEYRDNRHDGQFRVIGCGPNRVDMVNIIWEACRWVTFHPPHLIPLMLVDGAWNPHCYRNTLHGQEQ